MNRELVGKNPQEQFGIVTPELNIVRVETIDYKSGIPLKGFESVAEALNLFESGRARGSNLPHDNLLNDASESAGIFGVGLILGVSSMVNRDSFVSNMLNEAKPALDTFGKWKKDFDFDFGSFNRTTVKIQKLPEAEDGYLLGLNAAYVGTEVEEGLAETLGVERGLARKIVKVILESEDGGFKIDFDAVALRLADFYAELNPNGRIRKTPKLTGKTILDGMLRNHHEIHAESFILGIKDGLEISLNLGEVEQRFNWRTGNGEEQWTRDGQVLSGPLAKDPSSEKELIPPSIFIGIIRDSKGRYNSPPAVDPATKARMSEVASRVEAMFTN